DDKLAAGDRNAVERLDAVDVDEVCRLGEPERHGRNEALAPGEHAAVLGGKFGEQRDRFVDRFRRMITECGGPHCAMDACLPGLSQRLQTNARGGIRCQMTERSNCEYYHPTSDHPISDL